MKLNCLILLWICLIPCSLFAQQVTISGTVTDPAGLPIELVNVQVKGTVWGDYTNEKGRYSFSINPSDTITIEFSSLGYNTTRVVLPPPEEDVSLSVKMRLYDYTLEGVTVTAFQNQTTTMSGVHTENTRFAVDATGGSIESVIVMQGTGVSNTNELSTQYSVRGGSYDENMVYVNGIEIQRPLLVRSAQQEGMSFINPDLTGSVRFSSGGFDARYGDKMSSVLDVTYKTPEAFEGGVMASMLGGNVYLGSSTGKFSQITGFRYKRGTTLLKTLDTKGDYEPTALDFQTFMTYTFSPKLSLSLMGNFADNTYDFTPSTRQTNYGNIYEQRTFKVYYDGKERDRFQTLFGAGILKYAWGEQADVSLQISAFQSREEVTYDITGDYWISNVTEEGASDTPIGVGLFHQHARNYLNSKVFKASLRGNIGISQHNLSWGADLQQERIKDNIVEWEMIDSMGYSLPRNDEYLTVSKNLRAKNEIESNRFSAFLQDTYKFRIKEGLLSLVGGVRGSYWTYNDEWIVSPRVSVGFVPSGKQNITLRFATGIYYQPPFYKEFRRVETDEAGNSYVVLNEDIQSQRSIHFVLGGDYAFRFDDRPFKFTAEVYYKKLDNLIPYTMENVRVWYSGRNESHGYAAGLDTKLFGQFIPGTDSWLGFSLMEAKQYINDVKYPMPTEQSYNLTFYYTDYFPQSKRIQGNLRAIWGDGINFSVPGYEYRPVLKSKAYRRVDFGLSYLLWGDEDRDYKPNSPFRHFKTILIGVDCFNLLDIKNVSSYSWFSGTDGSQNAVPDRLTGRQFNIKIMAQF